MSNTSSSTPTGPITLPLETLAPGALQLLQTAGGSLQWSQSRALTLNDAQDLPYTKKLLHDAERESATYNTEAIQQLRPADSIIVNLSDHDEESVQADAKLTWYVKPLDGIQNYEHGYSLYTLAISLVDNRTGRTRFVGIYSPQYERTWWTEGGKPYRRRGRRQRTELMEPYPLSKLTVFATNYPRDRMLRRAYLHTLPQITDRFQHLRMFGSGTLQGILVAEGRMNALLEFDVKPASYIPTTELIRLSDGISELVTLKDKSVAMVAARKAQDFDFLMAQLQPLQ